MKSKRLILCLLLWLGMLTGATAQDTLTVVSYNIYHAENATQPGHSTLQDIAQLINKIDPDVVALQEVDSATVRLANVNDGRFFGLADSLAEHTNMSSYFGQALDFDDGGYGVAMLSKKSAKVRIVPLANPQDGEPRVLLSLETTLHSGRPVIFAATHLDHQYNENRLAQVEAINRSFSTSTAPVILAGDFNFLPNSREYAAMQDLWLDAGLQSSGESAPTCTYPSKNPEKRIDYIWLSKNAEWRALEYKTLDVTYSDHLPVVAKVVFHP